MVVVDPEGCPHNHNALPVLANIAASHNSRLEIDAPGPDGKWQRTGMAFDTEGDPVFDDAWRQDICKGAKHIQEETWVPANDPHYDAKLWPHVHPHGTGSLLSEIGSGGSQRHARNRLMLIQSWFRRSAHWGFWFLHRLTTTELFFKNKKKR